MNASDSPTHPAPAEWADFLYGELPPDAHAGLESHLRTCAECQRHVAHWRETMGALDAWKLSEPVRPATTTFRLVRWAAAAAVVLGLGWLGGRLSAPAAPSAAALRAELLPALRQEVQAAVNASEQRTSDRLVELVRTWSETRAEDRQATLTLYQQAEQQRRVDQAALRRDLETVAVVAETAIAATQRRLDQLSANAAPPAGAGQP